MTRTSTKTKRTPRPVKLPPAQDAHVITVLPNGAFDSVTERVVDMWLRLRTVSEISSATGLTKLAIVNLLEDNRVREAMNGWCDARKAQSLSPSEAMKKLAPRAVQIRERQLSQAEAGQLNFNQETQVVNDVLDRGGLPKQSSRHITHEHSAAVTPVMLRKLDEIGRQLLEAGGFDGLNFRSIGAALARPLRQAEAIEVEAEEVAV